MDEAAVIIALRAFSGPNLGAEVMLPPGTYIIGTDHSCDIVLSDSSIAPRHAALTAEPAPPGQLPRVYANPLDAAIILNEESFPAEGRDLPQGAPWFLGLTCLAWNTPDAPREVIIPNLPGQVALTQPESTRKPLAGEQDAGSENTLRDSNDVGIGPTTELPRRKRWPLRVVAVLLLVALCALLFEFRPGPASMEEPAAQLRQELAKAGLDKLVVSGENGRITITGTVMNEKERSLIWTMARNLKSPVYVRVGVRDDIAQAVKMKLNTKGVFPEVTFPGDDETMRIAAYIKDTQTENAVFASLGADLPELPQLEKRIVHADRLQPLIEAELNSAQLRNIHTVFGPGRMEITDNSSSGNHGALQAAMQKVEKSVGFPLAYTIISQDTPTSGDGAFRSLRPLVSGGISPDMSATSPGTPLLDGVRITGVTLRPMRFVSLGDGQRVFEGGMLPGGHVLEGISLDALTLSKNGRTTIYPLRGGNE